MQINEFIDYLQTQTQSRETIRAYRQDLERFGAFLEEKGLRATQVKPSTIMEFTMSLSRDHGRTATGTVSPATIARRLAVISRYYEWLQENSDRLVRNPVSRVRRPRVQNGKPRAIDESILNRLIEGIEDVRDRSIMLLFLYSGLRLSELQQLNQDSITVHRRKAADGTEELYALGEVIGKGRKRRQFVIGARAVQAVAEYLKLRRDQDPNPALFLSTRKTRLSCRAMQQILDKWCKRCGLGHLHVHQLRHTFATRSVNAGMSSAVLRELMGHSNLTTTQRYFHIRQERLAREYHAAMEFVRQTSAV